MESRRKFREAVLGNGVIRARNEKCCIEYIPLADLRGLCLFHCGKNCKHVLGPVIVQFRSPKIDGIPESEKRSYRFFSEQPDFCEELRKATTFINGLWPEDHCCFDPQAHHNYRPDLYELEKRRIASFS